MSPHGSVPGLARVRRAAEARGHDDGSSPKAGPPRAFLFLQGPISPFFDRLAHTLIGHGHRVHRVTLHLGDELFWRLPFTRFRGRFEEWRAFVGRLMEQHQITDVVLHGDRRPYHLVAGEEARARGISVICTDLGYLRPHWITLEHDGMSTYSRFPRDPEAIRTLAERFPAPDLEGRSYARFSLIAAFDVAYNLAQVFGRPLYPHYRRYGIYHPLVEYAGWLAAMPMRRMRRPAMDRAKAGLEGEAGSYFLFPLQLATDYQIRAHSPFADAKQAALHVVESFAASGSSRRLVVIIHPLDNGLIAWRRLIDGVARARGVADRVTVLDGGTPSSVLANAAGVVTINSTVGLIALRLGVPVKVLGHAVFDVEGLSCQTGLDTFWHDPCPPDRVLLRAFIRALIGTTQVRGGYYERAAQEEAAAGAAARLDGGLHPLPPLSAATLGERAASASARPIGRRIAITGAASMIGLALARAFAEPGVSLFLVGSDTDQLERTAQDCRLRGAEAEIAYVRSGDMAGLAGRLEDRDRRAPLDLLIAAAGLPYEALDRVPSAVDLIAERMRHRRRGTIALLDPQSEASSVDGGAGWEGLAARARALRRQLRPANVDVVFVGWGFVARRLLARRLRLGLPPFPFDPERVAALTRHALARGRASVAYPVPLSLFGPAARPLPDLVEARFGSGWPGREAPLGGAGERPALSREPAGD